jgi:rhodanese-related sulfurtransferase
MKTITRQELKAKLDVGADIKLVMTVGGWTFRTRHIPGSVNYPSPSCALQALRRDDEIILYSTSQHRQDTVAAFDALKAHGYRNVCCYLGGLADWEDAGYPVEGEGVGSTVERPPHGHSPMAESCAAAARTVTTAGRATAGRHRQPGIMDGGMVINLRRQVKRPHWLRSTRTLTRSPHPEGRTARTLRTHGRPSMKPPSYPPVTVLIHPSGPPAATPGSA